VILPRRKKLTPNLQLLYDEIKEKCKLLSEELSELLHILPRIKSTDDGRSHIIVVRSLLGTIMTTSPEVKRELASVFEADFGTIFPDEIIAQRIPRE